MRTIPYLSIFGLCMLSLVGKVKTTQAKQSQKPNIVFILADDLGYGDISINGGKINTPNIDRIAKEGMRFTNAYSPSSVSTPSRYNLLTGRYAWRTYTGHKTVWINDPLLIEKDRLTIAELLKNQGYRTACIGKWHLGFGRPGIPGWDPYFGMDLNGEIRPGPLEVGFDYFWGFPHVGQFPHVIIENHRVLGLQSDDPIRMVPGDRLLMPDYRFRERGGRDFTTRGGEAARYEHEALAVRLTEAAELWLEKQNEERPFFLYLAHRNIHGPIKPNSRFIGKSEMGARGDFILELDWSVGQILKILEQKGLAENTLVIFSSDNGAIKNYGSSIKHISFDGHLANGPYRGQKTEDYEGGVHVPFLARWPGEIRAGTESESLIALTDMLATLADYFNIRLEKEEGEDSFSFLGSLLGQKPRQSERKSLILDGRSEYAYAIRKGGWKLIIHQHGGGIPTANLPYDTNKPPGQLYNLRSDPEESNNLYEKHPEMVEEMMNIYWECRNNKRSAPLKKAQKN